MTLSADLHSLFSSFPSWSFLDFGIIVILFTNK